MRRGAYPRSQPARSPQGCDPSLAIAKWLGRRLVCLSLWERRAWIDRIGEIETMSESSSHRRAKNQAAGKNGQTEVPLPGGRRLDARTPTGRAIEIERRGTTVGLQ